MAKASKQPHAFRLAKDDPLAGEHAAVTKWIEDALSSLGGSSYYQEVELKGLPSGQLLLDAKGEQARNYLVAAVAQTRHWDQMADRVRQGAENELQRINAHHLPGWSEVWCRRRQAEAVVRALIRRKLPLASQDLLDILVWCNEAENISPYHYPLTYIVRALERSAESGSVDDELSAAMQQFAAKLRSSHDNKASRLGTTVEQLCAVGIGDEGQLEPTLPPPNPAPAGQPQVLEQLKTLLGMTPDDAAPADTVAIGPDQYPLSDDSPLKNEHQLLTELFEEVIGTSNYYQPQLDDCTAGKLLLKQNPDDAGSVLLAAAERHVNALLAPATDYSEAGTWQARYAACGVVSSLAKVRFSLPRDGTFDLLLYLSARPAHEKLTTEPLIPELIELVERDAEDASPSEGERYVLSLFRASLISGPMLGARCPTSRA